MLVLRFRPEIRKRCSCFRTVCNAQFSSEHRVKNDKKKKFGFEQRPDIKAIENDYIGPADKISNLRPIIRHVPKDETPIERQLRLKKIEVEEWNQSFWTIHNQKFITEKQTFVKANKKSDEDTLSADKMSEFYKTFLDSNWQSHFDYNREWYKKNFEILLLSYRTKFQLKKLFARKTNS